MSMNGVLFLKDSKVKGTDSNRFMWTASFPGDHRQKGWGTARGDGM